MFKPMLIAAAATMLVVSGANAQSISGKVKKVDVSAGKMTIIHGPIKHLNMMHDMTMVFRVAKPEMLKQVKAGDRIKFEAKRVNGAITVMKLNKSR